MGREIFNKYMAHKAREASERIRAKLAMDTMNPLGTGAGATGGGPASFNTSKYDEDLNTLIAIGEEYGLDHAIIKVSDPQTQGEYGWDPDTASRLREDLTNHFNQSEMDPERTETSSNNYL